MTKWYFSTKGIPALYGLSFHERLRILDRAQMRFTVPEKLFVNLCKLSILIPLFVLLVNLPQNWFNLFWIALLACAFPLIIRPIQLNISVKYLPPTAAKEDNYG